MNLKIESDSDPFLKPQRREKHPSIAEANKNIQLRKKLINLSRQARLDQVTDKENNPSAWNSIRVIDL
jgi:hypothetical protein